MCAIHLQNSRRARYTLTSETLRKAIAATLSSFDDDKPNVATAWIALVKARMEAFDYWSHVYGAFGSFAAGGLALAAILSRSIDYVGYIYAAASGLVALYFGIRKFEIDRRKVWYKYVLCQREGIKSHIRQ